MIADIGGDGDQTSEIEAVGEPYWSWTLRQITTPDRGDLCRINADNYVWYALETYWTEICARELASQDGNFHPPKKPANNNDGGDA